jgi:hypothetical protein
LAHRYNLNADASDLVGGPAWDGTPMGGAYFDGNQVVLDSTSGSYVQFPAGIITNNEAISVEAWASFGANQNWAELFCFGDQNAGGQGRYYIMMTPRSGNNDARVSIADGDPGYLHELVATRPGILDGQANVHIVGVYHPFAGYIALYLNGVLAGINTNITIPLSSVADVYNFLGHSIYNSDPFLNCSVSEYRIYTGPLSPQQIAIDAVTGPDSIVTDPGALQAIHLGVQDQMMVNITQQASLTGDFANVSGVNLFAFGQPTLVSGNTNVLTVTASGLIRAVAPGTTTVTATYGSFSDTKTISVVILPPLLAHRYSFTSDASDSVGGTAWDGTLPYGGTFQGGQLALDPQFTEYVQLPSGIINGYYALTMEAWASFGPNAWWCRLYDFGDQAGANGNTSIFFTPHGGEAAGIEATIFVPGDNNHVSIPGFLDNLANQHIVVVYNPTVRTLSYYLNGRLMGENRNATIPISAVNNVNSWIGRSLFNADAYLNASIDEFRIYNGALAASQVAVNDAAGPNIYLTDPGALQGVRFLVNTNMIVDQTQQVQLLGDFANVSGVNLFLYDAPALSSSDTNVLSVTSDGLIKALAPGRSTISVVFGGNTYTKTVFVAVTPLVLKHRYSFEDAPGSLAATDAVGSANATVFGNTIFDGAGQMVFDGSTDTYAQFPSPFISVLSNCTFEVWVTPTTAGSWQRIFDFGIDDGAGNGLNYMFLSSRGAPGMRFTVNAGAGESPILNAPTPLFIGQQAYVAGVYNVSAGIATLYQDGVAVASGPITSPLSAIQDVRNWLGRSQYAADTLFIGSYNEFRVYEGSLTPGEVAASFANGPNTLPAPVLQVVRSGSSVQVSWPDWAARYSLQSSSSLGAGAVWNPVSGTPVSSGGNYSLTLTPAAQAQFYRLVRN